MHIKLCSFVAACGLLLSPLAASAEGVPAPEGVVTLNASAVVEVPKDWLSITFSTQREGVDANAVQGQLKAALEAALGEARRVAKPGGQVEVQGGAFSLQPRYNSKGTTTGWVGNVEMVVEGRDMPTIAQLVGRINTLTIARLNYSLSREAREKVEAELSSQAIARFRAKAGGYAKDFGYERFVVREVNVQTDMGQTPPRMYAMAKSSMAGGDEALPVEAGKGTVTATVSGSVQLLK